MMTAERGKRCGADAYDRRWLQLAGAIRPALLGADRNAPLTSRFLMIDIDQHSFYVSINAANDAANAARAAIWGALHTDAD